MAAGSKLETAVFGGGCFWCTEAIFQNLRGVKSVTSGYAGGLATNISARPTYEGVSSGQTGYAEVIKIEFDPKEISYSQLLEVFFATHDPTTLNRQGADIGSQYRSIILYSTDEQANQARQSMQPGFVTELLPLGKFYDAEEYHKNYYVKNKNQPYCQLVVSPKLEKFRRQFSKILK